MRPLRPALALAAAALAAAAAAAQGTSVWSSSPAVGLGPILMRAESPLAILRFSPTPEPPVTLDPGQWQVEMLTSWCNYFDVDPALYTIDAESLRFSLHAAYGFAPRFDVKVALPVAYRGGGILDRFITDFEGLLKVPNEARKQAPRNRYLILIRGQNGQTYERSGGDAGWGIEDATVSVRYQLAEGTATKPAITLSGGVKVPTGRQASLYSSGGYDLAAGVSLGQRLGRFNLYASAFAMHYATTELVGVRLTSTQNSLFAGLEFRKSARTSWVLQGLRTSPGAEHFGGLSRNSYELTLGFKHVLGPHLLLEASLLENLIIFDNSPDVGFHVGLVWRSPRPDGRAARAPVY